MIIKYPEYYFSLFLWKIKRFKFINLRIDRTISARDRAMWAFKNPEPNIEDDKTFRKHIEEKMNKGN